MPVAGVRIRRVVARGIDVLDRSRRHCVVRGALDLGKRDFLAASVAEIVGDRVGKIVRIVGHCVERPRADALDRIGEPGAAASCLFDGSLIMGVARGIAWERDHGAAGVERVHAAEPEGVTGRRDEYEPSRTIRLSERRHRPPARGRAWNLELGNAAIGVRSGGGRDPYEHKECEKRSTENRRSMHHLPRRFSGGRRARYWMAALTAVPYSGCNDCALSSSLVGFLRYKRIQSEAYPHAIRLIGTKSTRSLQSRHKNARSVVKTPKQSAPT